MMRREEATIASATVSMNATTEVPRIRHPRNVAHSEKVQLRRWLTPGPTMAVQIKQ